MERKPGNHREVRETALVHLQPTAENSQNRNKKEQRGLLKKLPHFCFDLKKTIKYKNESD